VGHVRKIKGVDVLIRAAERVCRIFPEAVFLVVGAPPEEAYFQELKDLCAALGLGRNFKFVGEREDVLPILKNSHVFCLPSRSEGFSNALIEAMACALPSVATDVGGNDEALTDGTNGYLVPSEDTQLMADRILDLLRSPEKASKMGRAARARIEEQFTFEAMIGKLVGVYDDLVLSKRV
jgi:glycosyltransferase involved in cell wall biosynthesis